MLILIMTRPGTLQQQGMRDSLAQGGHIPLRDQLLWIDPFASITPAVPLDHSRVVELGQFAYPDGKTPRHLQENFHVATDAADVDLLGKRGKWRGISPEEMQHSLIFALAKCIEDKAGAKRIIQD